MISVCQVVNHFRPGLFFSLKFYIFVREQKRDYYDTDCTYDSQ